MSSLEARDSTVFKMEGIRIFNETQDGTSNTPKIAYPPSSVIGFVFNFDLQDMGDDKEVYRHSLRINSGGDRDDYTGIIGLNQLLSLDGDALKAAAPAVVDIDRWARQFAMMSLFGVSDVYGQASPVGNIAIDAPHNLNFLARSNGVVDPIPWDWDRPFSIATNSDLVGKRNINKLFKLPGYARIYNGHLDDLMKTRFTRSYVRTWARLLDRLTGEDYATTEINNWIRARLSHVDRELPDEIPFEITTNSGNPFSVNTSSITLEGKGWINVREIFVNNASSPIEVTWLDDENWSLEIPLFLGVNTITLSAKNFSNEPVGMDSIEVTTTEGGAEPAAASNLIVTELNYDPLDDSGQEFIELMNISSSSSIDLTGVRITEGVTYNFANDLILTPGQRIIIARETSAYTGNAALIGAFLTGRLSSSEQIIILARTGETIVDFTYNSTAPWPEAANGAGATIVVRNPSNRPDLSNPFSWRLSAVAGGSPGGDDAIASPTGDPLATALIDPMPIQEIDAMTEQAIFSFTQRLGLDNLTIIPEESQTLQIWDSMLEGSSFEGIDYHGDGTATLSYRTRDTVKQGALRNFFRVRVIEE